MKFRNRKGFYMQKIILASASPRRRELLETAGVDFEILVSQADESVPDGTQPEAAAVMTAEKKARAVKALRPDGTVIGADTVVVSEGEIMGKPADRQDAVRMLSRLSGKVHTVVTGVCILGKDKEISFAQSTKVEFYPLSDGEIKAYVDSGEPMDKAGAYGIQGLGGAFVVGYEGRFDTVVGLSLALTEQLVKEAKSLE